MIFLKVIKILLIILFFTFSYISYAALPICIISEKEISNLLIKIKSDQKSILNLTRCQKKNKILFSILINDFDPRYIKYADQSLKSNPSFFYKFLPLDYKIIKYASSDLKNNKEFVLDSIRINVDILNYISPILLNDKEFAIKLITINPKSYLYLSDQLQTDINLATIALKNDATIFPSIAEDIKNKRGIVKEALISHPYNFNLLNKKYQNEEWIKDIKILPNIEKNNYFNKYLKSQYSSIDKGISLSKGYKISNQAKNFSKNRVFSQEYPLKWHQYNSYDNKEKYKMILSSDFENGWGDEFNKYPKLIDKIKNYLIEKIDKSALESLTTISIWEISDKKLVFNLYGIRDLPDNLSDEEIINVNSFTAIAILDGDNWQLDIVDAIYDSNIKTDLAYKNGHKRLYIWDLYKNEDDFSVIFKVEDRYSEYFQIYQDTKYNNYRKFYQIEAYYNHIIIDPNNN